MTVLRCSALLFCLSAASVAQADIYKCVDEPGGSPTYTNEKPAPGRKGCTLLSREQPISTVPAMPVRKPSATPTPSNFPRVDDGTQKSRDNDRRRILEQELATEEKALDEARKALTEQESVRTGDERNYARFLERVQPFKDKVALHERNVEAIRKEISNLR